MEKLVAEDQFASFVVQHRWKIAIKGERKEWERLSSFEFAKCLELVFFYHRLWIELTNEIVRFDLEIYRTTQSHCQKHCRSLFKTLQMYLFKGFQSLQEPSWILAERHCKDYDWNGRKRGSSIIAKKSFESANIFLPFPNCICVLAFTSLARFSIVDDREALNHMIWKHWV